MLKTRMGGAIAVALCLFMSIAIVRAGPVEKRIGLVIGNAAYQAGALATPANDAGLIAQTLQAAGFDVVGARDLDEDSLRHALRDFVDKAAASGPDTVAFVYFAGHGLQLEGENYLVPIDARIERDADVPVRGIRLYDFLVRPLSALPLKASFVVIDGARANPFARSGQPLAGGLALIEPPPNALIAFNAAPSTIAPEGQGPYGPYAQSLAEMIREPGLQPAEAFNRVRLRVSDLTKGAQVPWSAAQISAPFVFFERAADAPPPVAAVDDAVRMRPLRDREPREAYAAALEADTIPAYEEFVAAFPDDALARRVRALLAARREALVWRRTCAADSPDAYWSYLRRYPRGPHAYDARRRLARLAAALEPPPSFAVLAYDVPPPPPEEVVFIERPVIVFDDPVFALPPPPPPPIFLLPPPPPEFVVLPPPPPPVGLFVLPAPVYRPIPVWVRPPVYVAPPPPNNVIYTNVHNTVIVNQVTNTVSVTTPSGQPVAPVAANPVGPGLRPPPGLGAAPNAVGPPSAPTAPMATAAPATAAAPAGATAVMPTIGPSLPPSVQKKAGLIQGSPGAAGAPGAAPSPGTGTPAPLTSSPGAMVPPATPPAAALPQPGKPGGPPAPGTPGTVSPPLGVAATPPAAALPQPGKPGGPPAPGTPGTASPPPGVASTPPAAVLPQPGKPGGPPAPGTPGTASPPPGVASTPPAAALPQPGKPGGPPAPGTPGTASPPPGGAATPPAAALPQPGKPGGPPAPGTPSAAAPPTPPSAAGKPSSPPTPSATKPVPLVSTPTPALAKPTPPPAGPKPAHIAKPAPPPTGPKPALAKPTPPPSAPKPMPTVAKPSPTPVAPRPPPVVARPASPPMAPKPPPMAVRPPPPPMAAKPPPAPPKPAAAATAGKKCVVENGKPVCR